VINAVLTALFERLIVALVDLVDKRVCVHTVGEVAVAHLFVVVAIDLDLQMLILGVTSQVLLVIT